MPDLPTRESGRTVHAEGEHIEVVRYDRAGKWWLEAKRPMIPARPVPLRVAVQVAVDLWEDGGTIHLRRPGGTVFDARVRRLGRAKLHEQDRRAANLG